MTFFGELAAVSLPWIWLTKLTHHGYLWSLFLVGIVVPQTSPVMDEPQSNKDRTNSAARSSPETQTLRNRKKTVIPVPVPDTDSSRSKISTGAPAKLNIAEPAVKRRFNLYFTDAFPLLMSVDKETTSEGECRVVASVFFCGSFVVVFLASLTWMFGLLDVLLNTTSSGRLATDGTHISVVTATRYFDRPLQAILFVFGCATLLFLFRIRLQYSKERAWFNWTLGGFCTMIGFWTSLIIFFQHHKLDSWFDFGFTPGIIIAARFTEMHYGRTAAKAVHIAYRLLVAVFVFAMWSLLPICIDHEHGLANDDAHIVDTHTSAVDPDAQSGAGNRSRNLMPLSVELRSIVRRLSPSTVEGWLLRPLSISLPFFWTATTGARLYETFKSVAAVEVFRLAMIAIMTWLSLRYYRVHTLALGIRQGCRLPKQLQSPTTNSTEGAGTGATTSSGGVTNSSGGVTTSSGGVTTSSGGVTTSSGGGATTSSGGATTSSGGVTTSSGGVTTSSGGVTTSSGGATTSSGGVTTSSGAATTSSGGATTSSGGATTSSGGATTSSGGVTNSRSCKDVNDDGDGGSGGATGRSQGSSAVTQLPPLSDEQRKQINRTLTATFSTHAFELFAVRLFFLLAILSYWTSCVWPAVACPKFHRCPKALTFVDSNTSLDNEPLSNLVYRQYQRLNLPSSLLWQDYCSVHRLPTTADADSITISFLQQYIYSNNFIEVVFPLPAVVGTVRICVVMFFIAYGFQTFAVSAVYRALKNAKLAEKLN